MHPEEYKGGIVARVLCKKIETIDGDLLITVSTTPRTELEEKIMGIVGDGRRGGQYSVKGLDETDDVGDSETIDEIYASDSLPKERVAEFASKSATMKTVVIERDWGLGMNSLCVIVLV